MTLQERFDAKYIPEPMSGCWLWTGSQHYRGYGRIRIKRNEPPPFAHRVSWELHCGPIPAGMHVRHRCDNPCCVNPDHLSLGTHTDNMSDKYARGRANHACGEKNPIAKLTDEIVRKIRSDDSVSNKEWSKKLNIDRGTIWKIRRGLAWRHIQ